MRGSRAIAGCVAAVGLFLVPGGASASPGDLDPSFAGVGFRNLTFEKFIRPVDITTTGSKILIAANVATHDNCKRDIGCFDDYRFLFGRYLADGTPDPSFGSDGITTPPAGDERMLYYGGPIAVTASGDIFANGNGMFHLSADGEVDEDFPRQPVPGMDIYEVAAAPGNKVILAGIGLEGGDPLIADRLMLARVDTDGNLDASYGDGGLVISDSQGLTQPTAMSVEDDGTVTIASADPSHAGRPALVSRFDADGEPIGGFGTGGEALIGDEGLTNYPVDIVETAGDGWLVADEMHDPVRFPIVSYSLLKLDEDGQMDHEFGYDGTLPIDDPGLFGQLDVLGDGSFISSGPEGMIKLLPNGGIDLNYGGGDGAVRTPWMQSVATTGLANSGIARIGIRVGGFLWNRTITGVVVVHGANSGPADSDADGVPDQADACYEVPATTDSGCPHLHFTLDIYREDGFSASTSARGNSPCVVDTSGWRLIRRRGSEVKRYLLKNDGAYGLLHGWGTYRFEAPRQLLPESGICPAAKSPQFAVPRGSPAGGHQ